MKGPAYGGERFARVWGLPHLIKTCADRRNHFGRFLEENLEQLLVHIGRRCIEQLYNLSRRGVCGLTRRDVGKRVGKHVGKPVRQRATSATLQRVCTCIDCGECGERGGRRSRDVQITRNLGVLFQFLNGLTELPGWCRCIGLLLPIRIKCLYFLLVDLHIARRDRGQHGKFQQAAFKLGRFLGQTKTN